MIRTFRHKGLAAFFKTGKASRRSWRAASGRASRFCTARPRWRMSTLPDTAFHALRGDQAGRWAIDVNGPWRITFEWGRDDHVYRADLEQYH